MNIPNILGKNLKEIGKLIGKTQPDDRGEVLSEFLFCLGTIRQLLE